MKKRSNVKILFLVGIVCGVLLMGSYVFNQDQEVILEETDIVSSDMVSIYIESDSEYTQDKEIPTSGYTFNAEDSYCTVDGEIDDSITLSYDSTTQSLSVSPMTTQGTKCYLYFDLATTLKAAILGDNEEPQTLSNLNKTSCESGCGGQENGLYQATVNEGADNEGTTYYFRGTVDNNWVSFAGFYWRIIRINEDGSVRLIYNGTTTDDTGNGTQLDETSAFNSSTDASYYVGYMYTASTYASIGQHGTTTDSTIKEVLDKWYEDNIKGKEYEKYIADSGFCGDREVISSYSWVSSGATFTYAAGLRSNNTPTFSCSDADLYTTSTSDKGNQALDYAIGLITIDEARYAGGYSVSSNTGYWLYTGQNYWTMSPYQFNISGNAYVQYVNGWSGSLNSANVNSSTVGVRPVINLAADVTISEGDGSSGNPYTVSVQ